MVIFSLGVCTVVGGIIALTYLQARAMMMQARQGEGGEGEGEDEGSHSNGDAEGEEPMSPVGIKYEDPTAPTPRSTATLKRANLDATSLEQASNPLANGESDWDIEGSTVMSPPSQRGRDAIELQPGDI